MPQRSPAPVDLEALAAADSFAPSLGIELVANDAEGLVMRLEVGREHLNMNGACHGGVIFALADSAFGLACNAAGTLAVGLDAHITYTAPVRSGDVLVATAREVSRSKRVGVYRVEVNRAMGDIVATFSATAFITDKRVTIGAPSRAGA